MEPGKVVVITGAAGGIGRALVEKFLGLGATVWAVDLNETGLQKIKDEASKYKHELHTATCDVTAFESVKKLRDDVVKTSKRIDYWVNNAGIAGLGSFSDQTPEAFKQVIDVNLWGVVHGTRVAMETMETQGYGWIVNMASVAGHLPAPLMSAYNASKHAVVGFTRSLQIELPLKDLSTKILLVSPGFVDTPLIAKGAKLGFPEWLNFLLSKADDVANEIIAGLRKGKTEIYPTLNGKVMLRTQRFFPKATALGSRIFLTKNFKDIFLNRLG